MLIHFRTETTNKCNQQEQSSDAQMLVMSYQTLTSQVEPFNAANAEMTVAPESEIPLAVVAETNEAGKPPQPALLLLPIN